MKENVFGLAPRQYEVFKLMAEGKSNSEIGEILGISPFSVKATVKLIFEKYGVSNRICAVIEGIKRGALVIDVYKTPGVPIVRSASPSPPPPPPKPKEIREVVSLRGLKIFDNCEAEMGTIFPVRRTLPRRGVKILQFLADPVGRIRSRQAILDAAWGADALIEPRVVDVRICHLRKFLGY